MIDLKKLIEASVHFGHRISTWSPKMKPYIWGKRGNICLIDVSKTAIQLEKAAKFLEKTAAEGKPILWIGTKKAAQSTVYEIATKLNDNYVSNRWIGGTLTNNTQVKKSVSKFLHYVDILDKSDQFPYTKKERGSILKMADRLKKNIGGIVDLKLPLGAVVVVDIGKEGSAVREAILEKIPVIALVDTNCDPSLISIPIPCNDDSPRSIRILLEYLAESVEKGKNNSADKKEAGSVKTDKKIGVKPNKEVPKKPVAAKVEKVATKDEKKVAPIEVKKAEKEDDKKEEKKVAAPKEDNAPAAEKKETVAKKKEEAPAVKKEAKADEPKEEKKEKPKKDDATEEAVSATSKKKEASKEEDKKAVKKEDKKVVAKDEKVASAAEKKVAAPKEDKKEEDKAAKAAPKKEESKK